MVEPTSDLFRVVAYYTIFFYMFNQFETHFLKLVGDVCPVFLANVYTYELYWDENIINKNAIFFVMWTNVLT